LMVAVIVATAVARKDDVFTSGRCERGDTALLDPRCYYGSRVSLGESYLGTSYRFSPYFGTFLRVKVAEQRLPFVWKPRTNSRKKLSEANRVLRKAVRSFSAISLRQFQIDAEGVKVELTEVIDRRGMIGVMVRYEKARKSDCFRMYTDNYSIGELGVRECNRNKRLATLSNVGKKGLWAAVAASGAVYSPVAPRLPSPLYRVRGALPRKPRKPTFVRKEHSPEQLYPVELQTLQTCSYECDFYYHALRLSVAKYEEVISHHYHRSTDARDLMYVTRLVRKVKKPWDAVEAEFMTVRYDIGVVQMIVGTDKNGFLGLIFNVAGRNLRTADISYFEGDRTCDAIAAANYNVYARLGADAARDSNVGRAGQHVFTLSQTGLLSGRRIRNTNAYNICYRSTDPRKTVDGVPEIVYAKYGTRYCEPGPKYVGFGLDDGEMQAWKTCTLVGKRALQIPLRDVRKAGAKDFKPFAGVLVRAPVTTKKGETFIAELVYLFSRDGRSAGVINVPPAYREAMHVGFYDQTTGNGEVRVKRKFTGSGSNVGVAGRNVFVLREVKRKPEPAASFTLNYPKFEILPS